MTTGLGTEPTKDANGAIISGTSSNDMRKIWGGLYSPGLVSGGLITRSASALTYTVSSGVAAISPATGQTILAPIPATTLTTTAPSSGTRTDIVYVQQRYPDIEGDSEVVVSYGTSLPARAVLLGSYTVSSSNTNSNSFVATGTVDFSIPYGASLGTLYTFKDTLYGGYTVRTTRTSATISLPTDRTVRFAITTSQNAIGAYRFDNSTYCEAGFDVFVDGVLTFPWSSPGLHQAWSEVNWSDTKVLPRGTHTVSYQLYRGIGPGVPFHRYTIFKVSDEGPVK